MEVEMSAAAMVLVGLMAGLGCCGILVSILSVLGVLLLLRLLLAGTYCAPDREAEGENNLSMHVTGGGMDEGNRTSLESLDGVMVDEEDEPSVESPRGLVMDSRRVPAFAGKMAGAGLVRAAGVVQADGEGDGGNRLHMRCGSCNYRYRVFGNGLCAGRSRGPPGFEGVL
jgi:hypothetical protein